MIKVQDWIASIPDEEKHIAYVGEGKSVQKEFLLCGDGWEDYRDWTFYLDVAFDPESIAIHDIRQVVKTSLEGTERETVGDLVTSETVTKESYTVNDMKVPNWIELTDIVPLTKRVEQDGIYLTWTVLRQHTQLPGKLWATLRGEGGAADEVKKSAMMVLEVDASVEATAAAVIPISEMEQIRQQASAAKDGATAAAQQARQSAADALNCQYICEDRADQVVELRQEMMTETEALRAEMAAQAQAVQEAREEAEYCARTADEHQYTASEHAAVAEQARFTASAHANSAVMACQHAEQAAEEAEQAIETVTETVEQAQTAIGNAVNHCARYAQRCEAAATGMETTIQAVDNLTYRRVNVRDCGAVGDGVADDRAAIIAAFELAKTMLPCEVYFPAGVYGIANGITVEMDYGTGGLKVCGAGRDVTTIRYLDSYDPDQAGNMWYAIRIWPVGRPNSLPEEADYLHDISFTGLTVHDPDPFAHAWHTAKGDPSAEETHGVDIHCCKGVSVTDCQFITVGDEAIDICYCHDVVVMNNRLIGSPGAGTNGGAISIGDGCKGVTVYGNTVNGSAPDETLEDGSVLNKRNFGIAVESLYDPVSDVVIIGNVIRNVRGYGINMGATTAGSGISHVSVNSNVIADCSSGIRVMDTTQPKRDISVVNNIIIGCGGDVLTDNCAISTGTHTYNLLVASNTIKDIRCEQQAVKIGVVDTALVTDNVFQDITGYALLTNGDVTVRNCVFSNIGTGGSVGQAIQKMDNATNHLTVAGCRLKNIYCTVGIRNADVVEDTDIQLANGGSAIASKYLTRVVGGRFDGILALQKAGAVMRDVTIAANTAGNHAVTIAASGVSVTGCHIYVGALKKAIIENDGCVGNLVANNIVNGTLSTAAALILADNSGTVCTNNIDLRTVTA